MVKNDRHRKVFFYLMFMVFLVLAIYVISPILQPIIAAIILAFIFHPLNNYLKKKTKKPATSALLTLTVVFLIIFVPSFFLANKAVEESTVALIDIKQTLFALGQDTCESDSSICELTNEIKDLISSPKYSYYISESAEKIEQSVIEEASLFLVSLPRLLMALFIMLVSLYYFLKDGGEIVLSLEKLAPLTAKNRKRIFKKFSDLSKSIVFGYVVAAIMQGIAALFGFWLINLIFGEGGSIINAPILWAAVLAIFSMLPILGSGVVWVPMSAYFVIFGLATQTTGVFWGGIVLAVYGLVVISNIDNLLRPLLAGKKGHVPPLVMYLGIFGGLFVFGFLGIFIGPIILALFITLVRIYEDGVL